MIYELPLQIIYPSPSMPKGRNKELIDRRDKALIRRYYYWTEVQRLRLDDTLRQLSMNEFFISEERIMAIIRTQAHLASDVPIQARQKVRVPRITSAHLALFTGE